MRNIFFLAIAIVIVIFFIPAIIKYEKEYQKKLLTAKKEKLEASKIRNTKLYRAGLYFFYTILLLYIIGAFFHKEIQFLINQN